MGATTDWRNLPLPGPLDLESTLYSGQAFRWRRTEPGGHLGFIDNEPVLLEPSARGLRWRGLPRPARLRHYFRLDASHERFLSEVRADDFLRTALASFPGLRLLRQDPWEILVSFVISQNSNEAKIRQTIERLCVLAGEPVAWGERLLYRFPTPARLARIDEAALRSTGMGYRAPYVHEAAQRVARGDLRPELLRRRSYQRALDELLAIHGIGEKVADCILLYGCDHRRAFPADVWVKRFVRETYLRRRPNPSYETIRRFAWAHFGAQAGYAQHYLFHYRRARGRLAANPSA